MASLRGRLSHVGALGMASKSACLTSAIKLDECIAGHELPVSVHAHDHHEIVEVPDAATELLSRVRLVTSAHQTHDLLAQRTLHAQHADTEGLQLVVADEVPPTGFKQEIVNERCDRHVVQLHRIFQARDSGHSSGSMPKSKCVVGLREASSACITSAWQRVSSIPSRALVPGL